MLGRMVRRRHQQARALGVSVLAVVLKQAERDYLKVSTLYDRLPEWAAPALFQAGQCEEKLQKTLDAEKSYTRLMADFPGSSFAKDAKKRLDELHKRPAG